jgi:hypothetical protein
MFGLEALLGPLVGKLIAGAVVVLALLATYFGIKRKGVAEERERNALAQAKERQAAQGRVDAARTQDTVIDQQVQERVNEITGKPGVVPPPDPPVKPGDKFKFVWLLPLLPLLVACPKSYPVTPVVVDIPPRPALIECPVAPHPEGTVEIIKGKEFVTLLVPDAVAIKAYLRDAPKCYEAREVILNGYIQKLLNRIQAVAPAK